jgi:hypothetical protein
MNSRQCARSWRVRSRTPASQPAGLGSDKPPTTRNPGGPPDAHPPSTAVSPATSSCAHPQRQDRRHHLRRQRPPRPRRPAVYVDLVVSEAQAEAGAKHLTKGQAVSFAGRFEPREFVTSAGDHRIALEVHDVAIEYGAKPRGGEPVSQPASDNTRDADPVADDIPF